MKVPFWKPSLHRLLAGSPALPSRGLLINTVWAESLCDQQLRTSSHSRSEGAADVAPQPLPGLGDYSGC